MSAANTQDEVETAPGSLQEPLLENEQSRDEGSSQPERLVDGLPLGTSLLLKSLYFLEALGAATWGRFGTIYYNLHGLNSQQIGILEGCMPFVQTLSQPVWGMIADQFHCRKAVYLSTRTIGTLVLLSLAIPYVYASFMRIMSVSFITALFSGAGILDAYTLDMLGTNNKMLYGRYRMWSSISWGIGAILMGYITDLYGFEPNFIIYGALAVISMSLVSWRIPNVDSESRQDTGKLSELLALLMRPRVLIFLLEVIVMGSGMAVVERLLFLYLVNDLGSSTLLCGLSVGVNVLFELPIFWYAKQLTACLGGHDGMMALALICFVVRVFGYTLLTRATVWWVLPLESMHGVTFACFWVSMMDVVKVLTHQVEGWNTTIPTVVQTLFGALGTGVGSIVGGWAMHRFGSRAMYSAAASILLGTLVLHTIGSTICRVCLETGLLPDSHEVENDEEESHRVEGDHLNAMDREAESLLDQWGLVPGGED